MAKKLKTKKQKILADLRRTAAPTTEKKLDSTTYSIPKIKSVPNTTPAPRVVSHGNSVIATSSYSYLSGDLIKTILLTVSVVITELVIKFLLKI